MISLRLLGQHVRIFLIVSSQYQDQNQPQQEEKSHGQYASEVTFQLSLSENFVKLLGALSDKPSRLHPQELPDQHKIILFMQTYMAQGFDPSVLKGKLVSSDNVPTSDPDWLKKVRYAQEHKLWHYHIGIPFYEDSGKGYLTSEYVVHFQKLSDNHIKLVDFSYHPPMSLPTLASFIGDMVMG